jgi:hypothetical protein
MAAKDPVAPEARKPHLSAEDAEQFASQIRPSWELLDFEGQIPDLGVPIESPLLKARAAVAEAPAAGAVSTPDTVIDGVPTFAVSGSSEPVPEKIKPMPIAAIGAPRGRGDRRRGHPRRCAADAAAAHRSRRQAGPDPQEHDDRRRGPGRAGQGRAGGRRGHRGARARERCGASTGGPGRAEPLARVQPPRRRAGRGPSSGSSPTSAASPAGRSRPGVTGADDDIVIPIAGPPKGLFVKLGVGAGALIALGIGLKVLLGSGDKGEGTAPITTSTAAAAVTGAAPPATTAAEAPPPAVPPPVTATATPSAVPERRPGGHTPRPRLTRRPRPIRRPRRRLRPRRRRLQRRPLRPPPKKGGGIIRETPF